mmetsp:Transcript_4677/g.8958  ORF Transcript_4677/g.8958 Transcript_4677/m.8958 type:complete len:520 (-) Transcript_4677:179-1738(-)
MKTSQAFTILISTIAASVKADGEVFTVHGSGTTNPSKCIWHIMSLFEERSQITTRLTYRAIGSSAGQQEFLGVDNAMTEPGNPNITISSHAPHSDFGSGDIPISSADYDALNLAVESQEGGNSQNNGNHMVHLPYAMSSVSFFHNIPGVPDGDKGLKLSPCLLARIFNGKIQRWDSQEIIDENQHIEDILSEITSPIYVGRRSSGSSSTKSITEYLHATCSNEWPADMVSSDLGNKWHVSTNVCVGSGGMTDCVRNNPGSIGYMDSGHGWSEELAEVNLRNADGYYLTSRYAHDKGGITDAAKGVLPDEADLDWGDVNFLNKSGPYTWPIVVMSYIYVRKDVNRFMLSAEERGLMKIFLESLYRDDYFGRCKDLGFSAPPSDVKNMALRGINMIAWDFPFNPNTGKFDNMWSFEEGIKAIQGMGKFVISPNRKSLAGVSIEDIAGAEAKLMNDVKYLMQQWSNSQLASSEVQGDFIQILQDFQSQKNRTNAALVLAALSFTMWSCVIVGWVVKRYVFFK